MLTIAKYLGAGLSCSGLSGIYINFSSLIASLLVVGCVSLIINSFLLILIKKDIFGTEVKNLVLYIPQSNTFYIKYFLFVYFLFFTVKYNSNSIYLAGPGPHNKCSCFIKWYGSRYIW